MLHAGELRQEAGALARVAEAVDHPRRHVVDGDVGGGGDAACRQLLEDERSVDAAQRAAADVLGDIDPGEAQRGGGAQRIDREDAFLIPARRLRLELAFGKGARRLLDRALLFGQLKIHTPRVSTNRGA